MELTKKDTSQTKGLAILFMVLLHLFCKKTDLPYTAWMLPNGVPLIYYLGLFGDQCVAMYCFCSGYAHYLIREKSASLSTYCRSMAKQLVKFLLLYWIVVLLTAIVGFVMHNPRIPGSIGKFALNFFLIRINYNGTWWFVQTYVLLLLFSGVCCFLCKKIHPALLLPVSFAVYFAGYVQRFKNVLHPENPILSGIVTCSALFATSVFPYIIGMLFRKYSVISKVRSFISARNLPRFWLLLGGIAAEAVLAVLHGFVQTLFVAPLIAVVTITVLNVVPKTKAGDAVLSFFGKHSSTIWLSHYFFIETAFPPIAFLPKYPVPIFLFCIALSIAASYVILAIYTPLQKKVLTLFNPVRT